MILSGEQWKGWDEALAMAVLKGRQLRVLGLADEGTAVEQEWTTITGGAPGPRGAIVAGR